MVLGWLCGGHAGLRPRLEHQEHGFDKSNFCLESLPNMTGLPNHRCRSRDWVVPAAIKQRHANELAAKDQEIEELRLQIGKTMLVDSAVALMTSAAVHLEHAPAAQMTKRARAGQLLLESLM